MKRTLLVVALAAVLVFAFASAAYADYAATNDFEAWTTNGSNAAVPTPHKGFTTTTIKCAVCHSVHNADVPVGAANQNLLLATDRANACVYCHIQGGISTAQVYGSSVDAYQTDYVQNHSDGSLLDSTYAGCTSCHAVHGAGTFGGAVNTWILKDLTAADPDVPAAWYSSATEGEAVTAFCAQCHTYYQNTYDTMTAATLGDHVMTDATGNYANHEASTEAQALSVAFTPSTYCASCHDVALAGGFPHYTLNQARFMFSGTRADGVTGTLADPSMDGACLKCHVNSTSAAGVNITY